MLVFIHEFQRFRKEIADNSQIIRNTGKSSEIVLLMNNTELAGSSQSTACYLTDRLKVLWWTYVDRWINLMLYLNCMDLHLKILIFMASVLLQYYFVEIMPLIIKIGPAFLTFHHWLTFLTTIWNLAIARFFCVVR